MTTEGAEPSAPVRVFVDLLASPQSVAEHPDGFLVIVDPLGGGAAALVALDEAGDSEAAVPLIEGSSLRALASSACAAGAQPWIADIVNARPACATLARELQPGDAVTFAAVAADGVFVAGVLVRTLLDELGGPSVLDDGAGIAIGVAGGTDELRAGLLLSARGRAFDASAPAGVSAVAALDSVASVGVVGPDLAVRARPISVRSEVAG